MLVGVVAAEHCPIPTKDRFLCEGFGPAAHAKSGT